jgi:hypothetical protein
MEMPTSQQINLYQPALRPARVPLSAATVARITLVFALGLVAISIYQHRQVEDLEDRLSALERLRDTTQSRILALSEVVAGRGRDAGLADAIQARREDLVRKQWVLNELTGVGKATVQGFSGLLEGLARQRVEGLWIDAVQVRDGGRDLALTGSARSAELVPVLLQRLGGEPAFARRAFRSLIVERPEAEPRRVDFALRTRPEPEDGP